MYSFELRYIMKDGSLHTRSIAAASIAEAVATASEIEGGVLYSVACMDMQRMQEDVVGIPPAGPVGTTEYGYLISFGGGAYLYGVAEDGRVQATTTNGMAMMFAPEEYEQVTLLAHRVSGVVVSIAPQTLYASIVQILRGEFNANTMAMFLRTHKGPLYFCHHQYHRKGYFTTLSVRAQESPVNGTEERFSFCFEVSYKRDPEVSDAPELTDDESAIMIHPFGAPGVHCEFGGAHTDGSQVRKLSTMMLDTEKQREKEASTEYDFRAEVRETRFTCDEIEKLFVRKGPLCELGTEFDAHTLAIYISNRSVTLNQLARQRGYTYKKICRKFRELVDILKQYRDEIDRGLYETTPDSWPITSIGIQAVFRKSAIGAMKQHNIGTLAELYKCCSVDSHYMDTLLGDKESVRRHTCAMCSKILGRSSIICKSHK